MYCTPQQVRNANELLSDADTFTDELITPWIAKAGSRIDARLRERYAVPLTDPVPEIIASIAQDMAAGFLIGSSFSNQPTQELLNLSSQLLKRGDGDLADVVASRQLDGLPGIVLLDTPGASGGPAVGSTTPAASPIEEILKQW